MEFTEIKTLIDEQGHAFEAYKQANDAMQAEIKKLGAADTVTEAKVAKLNQALDEISDALKKAQRPNVLSISDVEEYKSANLFSSEIGSSVDVDDYRQYKSGFNAYLRKGEHKLTPNEIKLMQIGVDPSGGYLVVPELSRRILILVMNKNPMRQICSVTSIGSDSLEGAIELGEAGAGWVGETQPRTETGAPTLGKWSIEVHELYALPKITQRLLDDAQMDVEGWLAERLADKIARAEGYAFLNGTGVLQPYGLLSYDLSDNFEWGKFRKIDVPSTIDQFFDTNKLITTVFSLRSDYRTNARWIMNRSTVGQVRSLKDGQGNYLWQPNFQERQGATLLGYPITEMDDMPDAAADAKPIAFGDFRAGYQIVDRIGLRVLRDPYTQKGFVVFYTTKRVGGAAVNFESIVFVNTTI